MKMTRTTERKTVRDTDVQPLGMYAVFDQRSKIAAAKFACLHDSYESASAEAIRLMTVALQREPAADRVFYVVEIVGRFHVDPKLGLRAEEKAR